jgi:hypothetical protein
MIKRNRKSGAVLIEMALMLPLLVLLLLGAIHFGYLFYLYNGLEKSVRDGARYGASRTFTNIGAYSAVVERAVVFGTQARTTPLVPGLNFGANQVLVEVIPNNGTHPERIRVTIQNYTYQGVLDFMLGGLTLNGKPSLEMPFIGLYRPS